MDKTTMMDHLYVTVEPSELPKEVRREIEREGGKRLVFSEDRSELVTWAGKDEWDQLMITLNILHTNGVQYYVSLGNDPDAD